MTQTVPADDPFWQFSIEFYQDPGVAEVCLDLQDRYGADVNVLLLCLWAAKYAAAELGASDLRALVGAVDDWQTVVLQPLRAIRRRLKQRVANVPDTESAAIRQQVLKLELQAEQIEQSVLSKTVALAGDPRASLDRQAAAAVMNMRRYFDLIVEQPTARPLPQTAPLLARLFAELSAKQIEQLLGAEPLSPQSAPR